jgi:hypothetical protein
MCQRRARFVYALRSRSPFLLAALVVAAMASLTAASYAAGTTTACEVNYYYDAAHTQWAGYCQQACYPGGAYCYGDLTDYYHLYDCEGCGGFAQQATGPEAMLRPATCVMDRSGIPAEHGSMLPTRGSGEPPEKSYSGSGSSSSGS